MRDSPRTNDSCLEPVGLDMSICIAAAIGKNCAGTSFLQIILCWIGGCSSAIMSAAVTLRMSCTSDAVLMKTAELKAVHYKLFPPS